MQRLFLGGGGGGELWQHKGRIKLAVFNHGKNLYAADIEDVIKCGPLVKDAVVGGQGRARPFLLLNFAACKGEEFWPHWSGRMRCFMRRCGCGRR
jgi:hypothetical protein